MKLLDKLLKKTTGTDQIKKLRVSDILGMSEQETARAWEKALTKKPVAVEDIKRLLEQQISVFTGEWTKYRNKTGRDLYLKVYVRICRLLLAYITLPERMKKAAEAEINARIEGAEKE